MVVGQLLITHTVEICIRQLGREEDCLITMMRYGIFSMRVARGDLFTIMFYSVHVCVYSEPTHGKIFFWLFSFFFFFFFLYAAIRAIG